MQCVKLKSWIQHAVSGSFSLPKSLFGSDLHVWCPSPVKNLFAQRKMIPTVVTNSYTYFHGCLWSQKFAQAMEVTLSEGKIYRSHPGTVSWIKYFKPWHVWTAYGMSICMFMCTCLCLYIVPVLIYITKKTRIRTESYAFDITNTKNKW